MTTSGTYAYIHRRPDGAPFYVGKGTLRRAKCLSDRNPWHARIVAKYGRKNIGITIIPCSTERVALDLEVVLIRSYRKNGVELCNFTDGGEGTSNPTPESRRRMSDAAKKRGVSQVARDALIRAKTGVPISEEQKKKQSESMRESWKNRTITQEHRANLKAAAKKRGMPMATIAASRIANLGSKHPHSEETKEKIRAAHLKRWEGHIPAQRHYPPRVRPERGWKHTDETRKKLSASHKGQPGFWSGKKRSPETIEKMRIATLSNPVRYWLGKKRSEETKLKISETKSRQLHHDD